MPLFTTPASPIFLFMSLISFHSGPWLLHIMSHEKNSSWHGGLGNYTLWALMSIFFPLSSKVCVVKTMVFPVVVYGCEHWAIKTADHQRIDAFELWCWRRCVRIPWTPRKSKQSILKEINSKYSLKGLMLKLKLHVLWLRDAKSQLIGKDPDAEKDWRQ